MALTERQIKLQAKADAQWSTIVDRQASWFENHGEYCQLIDNHTADGDTEVDIDVEGGGPPDRPQNTRKNFWLAAKRQRKTSSDLSESPSVKRKPTGELDLKPELPETALVPVRKLRSKITFNTQTYKGAHNWQFVVQYETAKKIFTFTRWRDDAAGVWAEELKTT